MRKTGGHFFAARSSAGAGQVAAIILAAGLATRFRAEGGQHESKLVAPLDGAPLVRHVAQAALASQARPLIVVTGHAGAAIRGALEGLPVTFAHNARYAEGLASSLQAGLTRVPPDAAGVIILLGDMPRVSSQTIDGLIGCFHAHPDCAAVVPTYSGARGNPALLAHRLFAAVETLRGDEGARRLLQAEGADVVEWEGDESIVIDIDTPEALIKAQR